MQMTCGFSETAKLRPAPFRRVHVRQNRVTSHPVLLFDVTISASARRRPAALARDRAAGR